LNAILSISCTESVYKDFYKIADKRPKGKSNGDLLAEMIQAYKIVKKEKSEVQ